MAEKTTYQGACHCHAVEFEVTTPTAHPDLTVCNCSHCDIKGFRLCFVPATDVKIIKGEDTLKTYLFNKKFLHHKFCPVCATEPFATADMHGTPMYGVNTRTLKDFDASKCKETQYDGKAV